MFNRIQDLLTKVAMAITKGITSYIDFAVEVSAPHGLARGAFLLPLFLIAVLTVAVLTIVSLLVSVIAPLGILLFLVSYSAVRHYDEGTGSILGFFAGIVLLTIPHLVKPLMEEWSRICYTADDVWLVFSRTFGQTHEGRQAYNNVDDLDLN